MKKTVLFLLLLSCVQVAQAALPPQFQNKKDLDVMISFVNEHPIVMSSLRSIDLQKKVIYYRGDCRADFGREARIRLPGWVGPAASLEFKKSNCSVK